MNFKLSSWIIDNFKMKVKLNKFFGKTKLNKVKNLLNTKEVDRKCNK